jgi:ATP-dependent RNA helicase DHX8/PRP22
MNGLAVIEEKDFEVLPVEAFREDILRAVRRYQIIICTGETGSGKTTQLPKYFMEAGYAKDGKRIGVTQPRRIAAISVAQRVSDELGSPLGKDVGYVVRFEEKISEESKIKFMTDGILIRECLSDRQLSQYSILMIDEAHERSLNTDILFGLLKECCRTRRDLKVIITSATLNTVKFGSYFNNCPIIQVPGRNFPVDIYHSKATQIMTESGPANNNYIQAAVDVVLKIHRREADGHILVFLTGQDEIEKACQSIADALREEQEIAEKEGGKNASACDRELIVLPLYAALPNDAQVKVFQKPEYLYEQQRRNAGKYSQKSLYSSSSTTAATRPKYIRKCIVATNIAETSITVPHVRFVVDAGYVKQKVFDPERGIESLLVVPVSKTASLQRAGRAGRTGPGHCYRLYSSDCFDSMLEETIPEIQRTSLAHTVLYLKALGISDVLNFDFLDPPSSEQVIQALHLLYMLHALDANGRITPLGQKMSQFPLEPQLSRMLIQSATSSCDCLLEMVIICAMLSVENIWITPRPPRDLRRDSTQPQLNFQQRKNNAAYGNVGISSHEPSSQSRQQSIWSGQEEAAETAHAGLRHIYGDFHTLHRVFSQWEKTEFAHNWCERHFISYRAMKQARKIREHLADEVERYRVRSFAEDRRNDGQLQIVQESPQSETNSNKTGRWEDGVSEAILSGFYMHAAVTCHSEALYKCIPLPNVQQAAAEARKHTARPREDDNTDLDFGGYEARFVHLHPQSALCHMGNPPDIAPCIIYRELVHSSGKLYIRGVAKVSPSQYKRYRRSFRPVSVAQLSQRPEDIPTVQTDGGREVTGKKRSLDEISESVDDRDSKANSKDISSCAVDDARARFLARKKK